MQYIGLKFKNANISAKMGHSHKPLLYELANVNMTTHQTRMSDMNIIPAEHQHVSINILHIFNNVTLKFEAQLRTEGVISMAVVSFTLWLAVLGSV